MYGIKYIIPFKTLSDIPCEIRLEVKDFAGEPMELKAGGNPIVIDTNTGDLTAPIRPSGATIRIYGSDYLQDLYASDPQGIKVTLLAGGVVKWLGYLTPDTFSQDFSSPEFIYEMEAVAAFSTLKYKKFDLTADFVSFMDIINKAIEYSGYIGYYLTTSVMAGSESYYSLKIPSANFYDELGEPMTYYEAMEEIAKYGVLLTWVPFGDKLYLIDYKAQREGHNSYLTEDGTVTLSDIKDVRDYRGTGAKISRIPGKNKATVNCSLYEVENLLPTFDDEKSIFKKTDETTRIIKDKKEYREIRRHYEQPKFEMFGYSYSSTTHTLTQYTTHKPLTGVMDIGSQFIRSASYILDNPPTSLPFADELLVKRHMYVKTQPGRQLNSGLPIIRFTSEKDIITHGDLYFCISLQVMINQKLWAVISNSTKIQNAQNDTIFKVWASLKIGDKSYNGSSWVTSSEKFPMPITVKKGDQMNEKYLSLDNTNTFNTGLGDMEGYLIKAPTEILIGKCELTIYDFEDSRLVDPFQTFLLDQYNRFKGIKLDYGIPNEQSIYGDWVDKDSKNDIVYENEISDDYVEEADDIELKICTNPDGKLALSSVMKGNAFLTEVTHPVYGTGKPETLILLKMTDIYGSPRFAISPTLKNDAKPYSVYIEPHLNRVYMVAGGEEDIKMESCTYNLIEI